MLTTLNRFHNADLQCLTSRAQIFATELQSFWVGILEISCSLKEEPPITIATDQGEEGKKIKLFCLKKKEC